MRLPCVGIVGVLALHIRVARQLQWPRLGVRTMRPATTATNGSCNNELGRRSTKMQTPNGNYLDRLMRRQSFEALWPLFAKAPKPAKEMTESFSALQHLRPLMPSVGPCRVIHVGDGAHARTAPRFALKTAADNISVDPLVNVAIVEAWRARFGVRRFGWKKAHIDDVTEELNALPAMPVFVTFVHAHVHVDAVLDKLRWNAAFTLACCVPGHQLTTMLEPHRAGDDLNVLSTGRRYQVLVNHNV